MIGIFLIATGSYIQYVPKLVEGLKKYFLSGHDVSIYVLTDYVGDVEGVVKLYHKHAKWPSPTLNRYSWILEAVKNNHIHHSFYYYLDADMECVAPVGDEILGKLVVTLHPGFYKKSKEQFSLETKFLSMAYVDPNKVKRYVAGGFNGGSDYLKMAEQITKWVAIDQKYGHTPCYHDETYLNRYVVENEPDVILSPEYCLPQTNRERLAYGISDLKPKIIAITKQNVIR